MVLDVIEDNKARQEMISKTGQVGVPVIDIDGKIIVGFDQEEIEKLLIDVPEEKVAELMMTAITNKENFG